MSVVPKKILEWSPEYSVHVAEIDREHQIWFDLVNRLHEAMLAGKGVELLRTLSREMLKHTFDHFAHEEELMAAVRYPGLPSHLQQHDALRRSARAFMQRYERGEVTITIELMLFLSEWVKLHVTTTDRQLGEYINKSRSTHAPGHSIGRHDPQPPG